VGVHVCSLRGRKWQATTTVFKCNVVVLCVILDLHYEVDEKCAFLGYYAARSRNFIPTFRENLSVTKRRYEITTPRCIRTQ
jgi:hypothetical protein